MRNKVALIFLIAAIACSAMPSGVEAFNTTNLWVAAGVAGSNTLAYSQDGVTWTGLGTSVFSVNGRGVAWDGNRWVAAGQGVNSLAYSSDGITWTGAPNNTSTFSTRAFNVASNGSRWVAVGQGTNTLAYSNDGISWTGVGTSTFNSRAFAVAWNGSMWVTGGEGPNSIAYSTDGISWTGVGTSTFSTYGLAVAWNGSMWVMVGGGTNSIAYSTDGIHWTAVTNSSSIFSVQGNAIAWNGTMWVAGGQGAANSLAYSYDGINWTGLGLSMFNPYCLGVAWNGSRFIASGIGNTLAYSDDGINWTGLGSILFSPHSGAIASAPAPKMYPALALSVPTISSISTTTAIFGDLGFTLTVNGTNFNASSTVVQWNGSSLGTTFVTSTQMTASVPGSKLLTSGAASVTALPVGLGGTASNAKTFNVQLLGSVSVGGGGGTPAPVSSGGGGSSASNVTTTPTSTPTPATPPAVPIATVTVPASSYKFERNLRLGMIGDDARELQKYLHNHGFTVSETGPGSPGNETTNFGVLTFAALVKFQEAYKDDILIPAGVSSGKGTGFLGPFTRAILNR